MRAVDLAGNRSSLGLSPTIVIDDFIAPTRPRNLQVADKSFHEISLAWQASTDENHQAILYRIFNNNEHVASTYDTHARIDRLHADTEYNLMIQAIDLTGNLSESDTLLVSTLAADADAPVFDYPHYRFGLFSNVFIDTIFARLEAYDKNNNVLNYGFIEGNEQGYFAINAQGEIRLQKTFNSTYPQQFELTLQASHADKTSNTRITINVLTPMENGTGGVSQEIWASTTDTQLNEFNFSLPLQSEQTLINFESLENMGSRYTQRLRGFLNVPESGLYSFWITSDDGSQLRISQDMSTEKTQMVASISGYTSSGNRWPEYSRDIDNVYLHKGQLYFIEAIHHELGGADHLSVGFKSAAMNEKALLTGDYLIPYSQWMPAKPQIQTAYQAGFSNQGNQIALEFTLSDSAAGFPVTVYYGEMDAGESAQGWAYANALGHLTAGNHTFALDGIEPGKTYFIRIAVEGPAGVSWSTSSFSLETVITDPAKQAGETLPQSLDISFVKNDQEYVIALEKHSIRSPNFQLLTFDSRRLQQFKPISPMPEPRTYRGTVTDNPYLTVTGVVDAKGTIHLSIWRGDARAFGENVDISAHMDTQALGNNETHNEEIIIDREIPPVTNNQFYLPPTGSEFHNYLARVSFKHENPQFIAKADSDVINALAQMEGHINEVDYIWAQKTGLRWDMGRALIEVHGDSTAEGVQARPAARDSTNFSVDFQDPAGGGYCWGGGDWVGCVANYTMNWGFTHEIGHNMGLGHGEQTDNNNQIQAPGTHMGNMQSRKTLSRLQAGTKFPPTQPIQQPMLPAAFKDYLSVYQNESGVIHPLTNDYDANGDSLSIDTFDATTQKGGTVSIVNDALHYTPPTDFMGVDQMTYTVTDGQYKTVGAIQIQVLTNGITGNWNMDTLSNNQMLDQSGRENHLTAPDLIKINSTNELSDLLVSGISDFAISIPLIADTTLQSDALGHQLLPHKLDPGHKSFSASVWFKYSNISGNELIIGKSSSGPNNLAYGGWEIRSGGENGDDLIIQINFRDRLMAENSVIITQPNAISDGIWHHVVMVLDRESSALTGYIDGIAFDDTGTLPASQSPVIAAMNTSGYGGGSPFKVGGHTAIICEPAEMEEEPDICLASEGQAIDLVKLFHKPLDLDEVNALYAEQ